MDDEFVMRVAFRKMLDWETSGFTLAASVSNGAEALAYLCANPVDIVVTDLKMPVMDGLELIGRLKEDGFSGAILVLSNYNDFELVRTALTRGASDYMLKQSIDEETLLRQLNAMTRVLGGVTGKQRPNRSGEPPRLAALREYFAEGEGASAPPQELIAFCRQGIEVFPCLLRLKPVGTNTPISYPDSIMDVLEQVFADTGTMIISISEDTVFLLLPYSAPQDRGRRMSDKLRQAVRSIRTYLNLNADVLMAPAADTPEQARQLFLQCRQALPVFFYPSRSPVQHLEDVNFSHLPESFVLSDATNRYISLYYGKRPDDAAEYWAKLMESCAALPVYPSEAKAFFMSAAQKIAFAVQTDHDVAAECSDADDAYSFLGRLCGRLAQMLDNARLQEFEQFKKYKKEVRDALLFIHFHFAEKITLDDVAKEVKLNRNYLCRLFRQETGEHMFRYISDLRMRKAAALIEDGNDYMRDVSSEVGIDDQFYFARVFKKYFGVSPSEYRKGKRNE